MDGLQASAQGLTDVTGEELRAAGAGPSVLPVAERLPFLVKLVSNQDELSDAVSIRQSAYARHVPAMARQLAVAEAYDYDEDSVVLLARAKLDRVPIGTMRIQTNLHRRLPLQNSVDLPERLQGQNLAQASRLGVSLGRTGRLAKIALFKAYYEYCVHAQVDWMVIAARSPLDRQYAALLFEDLDPEARFVPLSHVGGIPHRLLALEVACVRPRWHAAAHSLYDFFFKIDHPDIDVGHRSDMRRAHAALDDLAEGQSLSSV